MKLFVCLITLTLFATAFADDPETERLKPALDAITPDGLLAHIKMLASDEFEGRAPGSKGEELSIKYISDQFKQTGLSPGNPDGTYFTSTKLLRRKAQPRPSLFTRRGRRRIRIPWCARVGRRKISNSTRRTRTQARFRCVPGLRSTSPRNYSPIPDTTLTH